MPTLLETLNSSLDAVEAEFESYATPLITETRALTPEEDAKIEEIRSRRTALSGRIVKAEEDAALAQEVIAARQRLGTAQVDVHVTSEPRTYGPGSPNSYFADFVRGSNPMFPGHREALQRLDRYAVEVAGEMRDPNSKEGQRAKRSVASVYRSQPGNAAHDAIQRAMAHTGVEIRQGMDTTSGSGGSFVTPQYFVSDYAAYRQFDRVFADAANKMDLPDYGMTIYIPQVSGPAGVSAQVGQNAGITETDPTAGYLSTSLTTNAGQVTISQQLLDRAGPNFAFDKMVFDQLRRAYNLTLDVYVITQALANAGTVTVSNTPLLGTSTSNFYSSVAKAKAATVDAAGVVLPATHVFLMPINWEWYAAQADTTGRPLIVPDYAGMFNAVIAGNASGRPIADGDTGYKIAGLPVMEDGNIPTHSSNNQAIVAHMPEVWFWEGDLVNRVVPQTVAQNLSVLLQSYAYVGCIVRYPLAVQALQGAGLPTSPSF